MVVDFGDPDCGWHWHRHYRYRLVLVDSLIANDWFSSIGNFWFGIGMLDGWQWLDHPGLDLDQNF